MGEASKDIWHRDGHEFALTPAELQQIFDRINEKKKYAIGPSYNKDLLISFHKDKKGHFIELPHETVNACFDRAFEKPLKAAKKEIKHLKKAGGGLVVVSGGSSRHRDVQTPIKELCKAAGLSQEPIFVADEDDAA